MENKIQETEERATAMEKFVKEIMSNPILLGRLDDLDKRVTRVTDSLENVGFFASGMFNYVTKEKFVENNINMENAFGTLQNTLHNTRENLELLSQDYLSMKGKIITTEDRTAEIGKSVSDLIIDIANTKNKTDMMEVKMGHLIEEGTFGEGSMVVGGNKNLHKYHTFYDKLLGIYQNYNEFTEKISLLETLFKESDARAALDQLIKIEREKTEQIRVDFDGLKESHGNSIAEITKIKNLLSFMVPELK